MRVPGLCGRVVAILACLVLAVPHGEAQTNGSASPSAAGAGAAARPDLPVPTEPADALAQPPVSGDLKFAERLNRQGQRDQALREVETYLQTHPDDPAGRFLRGVILADRGQTQDAIGIFTLLTIDHPELEQPYNNLGVLYAHQGQLERARQSLEQAVQANPKSAVALENLGDVYALLAVQTYERATAVEAPNRTIRSKLTLARNLATLAASPEGATPEATNRAAANPPEPNRVVTSPAGINPAAPSAETR